MKESKEHDRQEQARQIDRELDAARATVVCMPSGGGRDIRFEDCTAVLMVGVYSRRGEWSEEKGNYMMQSEVKYLFGGQRSAQLGGILLAEIGKQMLKEFPERELLDAFAGSLDDTPFAFIKKED